MKYVLVDKGDNIVSTIDLASNVGLSGARTYFKGVKRIDGKSFDELWNTTPASWDTDSGDVSVSDSGASIASDSNDLAFLYIKNTGDTNEVVVALDGGTNYYITIPAGGSTQLRGDGTQLLCNEVYVKCNGGEASTIEYLVAKG